MVAVWISTAISVVTLVLSLGITLIGASIKWGQVQEKLGHMATKEELTQIKESLAEIKGMFTLRLKD